MTHQTAILAPVPRVGRHMIFQLAAHADPAEVLEALAGLEIDETLAVGLSSTLAAALGAEVPGLRPFPHLVGAGVEAPATAGALWCWLRGDDQGDIVHRSRALRRALGDLFVLDESTDVFRYGGGDDLTGYEDGTENPEGDKALRVTFVDGEGPGLDGGSFVAVQRWLHDLDAFEAKSPRGQDETIGRRAEDNEEMGDDAPASAHVNRVEQEDYDPPAFVVRRSMPWTDGVREGLVFVAFGRTLDNFEKILHRMVGLDDGVVDALFSFTRPLTGAYFWCPSVTEGRLNLQALKA